MNNQQPQVIFPSPQDQHKESHAEHNGKNNDETSLPPINIWSAFASYQSFGFIPTALGYITLRALKDNEVVKSNKAWKNFFLLPLVSCGYTILSFNSTALLGTGLFVLSYFKKFSVPDDIKRICLQIRDFIDLKIQTVIGLSRIAQHELADCYQYTVFLPSQCPSSQIQVQWSTIENSNNNKIFIYKKKQDQNTFDYYTSIHLEFTVNPQDCRVEYQNSSSCPILLVTIPKPKMNISTMNVIPVASPVYPNANPIYSYNNNMNNMNSYNNNISSNYTPFVNDPSKGFEPYQKPYSL
ncbi:hypothetical protein WA158_008256 [Blastocystis sp. Blastoise]